ncbi:MAG: tubulin/FtsZ family protein [Methanomicrobiales archaeon]|nr:tubulin/FtsZ family protein [Methanomicrobiales archaeon]
MRVLAIGLGGAGSRIADKLYGHDQRSGMGCVQALAVDVDSNTLVQLQHIPAEGRFYFPPVHPTSAEGLLDAIHVEEIVAYIQRGNTIHIDAILICCGLGGRLAAAAGTIVGEVRKSFIEPVFAVATLPCIREGERCAAAAADDLDRLQGITDAVILFDNEVHYARIQSGKGGSDEGAPAGGRNLRLDPHSAYDLLNERISRQIGLLLRAGEFTGDGKDVAEVVLDTGEVLNTLRGSGLVAVGYASEPLPRSIPGLLDRFRPPSRTIESNQMKAQRMVALAKRAVYEEMSVACDLTSAEKALVLIAGPSDELSMRGFQTIRKWIDRSIAGLEMRSGDYPLRDTRFVGVVIVLSGLTNIPRVGEIRAIRARCSRAQAPLPPEAPVAETVPQGGRGEGGEVPGAGAAPARADRGRPAGGRKEEGTSPDRPGGGDRDAGDVGEIAASPPDAEGEGEPKRRTVDRRRRRGGDYGDGLTWIR